MRWSNALYYYALYPHVVSFEALWFSHFMSNFIYNMYNKAIGLSFKYFIRYCNIGLYIFKKKKQKQKQKQNKNKNKKQNKTKPPKNKNKTKEKQKQKQND